jgi:Ca2+-binding RTX toxin-like protein
VQSIHVDALGGNDIVRLTDAINIPTTMNGGAGNDVLRGGAAPDNLDGGDGNDFLSGAAGNDTATGGAGNDLFLAAPQLDGNDSFVGGDGRDVVDYGARTAGVFIGLSDGTNTPEDTTDATMEIFAGGRGDDTIIIASQLPATGGLSAFGRDGNDTITSNSGDNLLSGGRGNDRLVGMFAHATLLGDAGDDFLRNFKGTDVSLDGGSGDDTFDVVEGLRTDVHGGDGFDTVDCRSFSFNSPVVTFDDVANDRISIIESGTDFSNVHSDVEKALGPFGMDTVNGG